jgi:hypothetical protein
MLPTIDGLAPWPMSQATENDCGAMIRPCGPFSAASAS